MNVLNKGITMAILSYVIVGDESLVPMLEELTNGSTQSHVLSSRWRDEAQTPSMLRIPATMPVDL